jgi:hypothetical protein
MTRAWGVIHEGHRAVIMDRFGPVEHVMLA